MTIYEQVKAYGGYIGNHESDLYIEVNEVNSRILATDSIKWANARKFRNEVTGNLCYDVPFAYDPWWTQRLTR
jgi:hypothetical protein